MAQFFKYFFAALLALIVFCMLAVFLLIGIASSIASKEQVVLNDHSVLFVDLGKRVAEQGEQNPFAPLTGDDEVEQPGVFDIVRMINFAKTDDQVDGLYLKCGSNANGFGTNEEIRNGSIACQL